MVFSLDHLKQTIQHLQQVQRQLPCSATLADVTDLPPEIAATYSQAIPLENVIQHLVGEHLAMQKEQRDAARRMRQELEVAA